MQGRGLTINNNLSGSQSSHLKFCQERKLLQGPGEIKLSYRVCCDACMHIFTVNEDFLIIIIISYKFLMQKYELFVGDVSSCLKDYACMMTGDNTI